MAKGKYRILLAPVVTEKSVAAVELDNTYTFQVDPKATKGQIKEAVEDIFDVVVTEVRTSTTHSKRRRTRAQGRMTRSHVGKRAVVKLAAEDRITIF